ncbi:type II toxin-antitoxin system MqsA family antitoxin [Lysobacter sp. P5_B9]
MTATCPLCERGQLEPRVIDETIRYDGAELVVRGIEISVCHVCGQEVVAPQQARANEVRFADAKRAHDGLLTSKEISEWRDRWHFTQQTAAALLGGGVNAFSKYERGEVIQSRPMDLLVRASDRFAELREFLAERAGVTLPDHHWVTLTQDDEPVERSMRLKLESNVIDVAAYRVRRAECGVVANDGTWHEDAGFAYGS